MRAAEFSSGTESRGRDAEQFAGEAEMAAAPRRAINAASSSGKRRAAPETPFAEAELGDEPLPGQHRVLVTGMPGEAGRPAHGRSLAPDPRRQGPERGEPAPGVAFVLGEPFRSDEAMLRPRRLDNRARNPGDLEALVGTGLLDAVAEFRRLPRRRTAPINILEA